MLRMIYNYLLYVFYAFVMAAIFGIATYFILYPLISDGRMLTAHILNFLLIVVTLLADKIEHNMMLKKKSKSNQNKIVSIIRTVLSPRMGHISFKTSLYLFYFFTLILSVALRLDNFIEVTDNFRDYIFTLEYGVMFLIAADMFIKHLIIDSKYIREMDNNSTKEDKK